VLRHLDPGVLHIAQNLAHQVRIARLFEIRRDHLLGIGLGVVLAQELRRPKAQQLVAPDLDPELQILIVLVLVLEGFLALVEGGHGPVLCMAGSVAFRTRE
jgi:hypothetical protein